MRGAGRAHGIPRWDMMDGSWKCQVLCRAAITVSSTISITSQHAPPLVRQYLFPWRGRTEGRDAGLEPSFRFLPVFNSLPCGSDCVHAAGAFWCFVCECGVCVVFVSVLY